jgi:hypothetical protein
MENPFQILQEELNQIKELLATVLKNTTPTEEPFAELPEHLTRRQTAKIFNVNLNSIDNWSREGTLKKHFIGTSVRFKKSEVLSVFNTVQKYQRKIAAS